MAQSKIAPIPSSEAFENAIDDETMQSMAAPPALVVHDDPSTHALKVAFKMRWDDYDRYLDVVWNSRVEDWFDREDILRWGDRHCRGILSYIGCQNQIDVNSYLSLLQSMFPQEELRAISQLSVQEAFCERELKFPGRKLLQYVMYSIRDHTIGLEEHRRLDEGISYNVQNSSVRRNIDLGPMWLQYFYNTTGETFEHFATRSLAETRRIPDNLYKAIERFCPGLLQDPTSLISTRPGQANTAQELAVSAETSLANLEAQGDSETQATQCRTQSTLEHDIDSTPAGVDPIPALAQGATDMSPQRRVLSDGTAEAITIRASEAAMPASAVDTFIAPPETLPAPPAVQTPRAQSTQARSRGNRRTSTGPIFAPHNGNAQPGPSGTSEWRYHGPRREMHSGVLASHMLQQSPIHFYPHAPALPAFERGSPTTLPGFGGLTPSTQVLGIPMVNTPQQQARFPPYIQPQGTHIHSAGQTSFGHQFVNPGGIQTGYLPTYGVGEMANQPFFAYAQDYVDTLPVAQGYTPSYNYPSNRPRTNSMGRGRRGRAYSGESNDSRALYNPQTGALDHYGRPLQNPGPQFRDRVSNFGQEPNYQSRDRNRGFGQDRGHQPRDRNNSIGQTRGATTIAGRRFSRSSRLSTSQNAGSITPPRAMNNARSIESIATSSDPTLTQAGGNAITENPTRRVGPTPPLKASTPPRYVTEHESNYMRLLMHSSLTDPETGEPSGYGPYPSPTSSRRNNRNPRSGKASKKARAKGKGRADEYDADQESFNNTDETDMEHQTSSNVATSKTPIGKIPSSNAAVSTLEASPDVDGTLRRTSEGGLIFEFQPTITAAEAAQVTAPKTNIKEAVAGPEATPKSAVVTRQVSWTRKYETADVEATDVQAPSNTREKPSVGKTSDVEVAPKHPTDEPVAAVVNKEPADGHGAISEPNDKVLDSESSKQPHSQTTEDTKTKDTNEVLKEVHEKDVATVTAENSELEVKEPTSTNNDSVNVDPIGEVKEHIADENDGVKAVPTEIAKQDVMKGEPTKTGEQIRAVTLADWQAAPAEIQRREAEEVKAFTEFYKKKLGIGTSSANTGTVKSKASPFKFEETFRQTAIEGSMGPRRVLSKISEYDSDESSITIPAYTPDAEEKVSDCNDAEVQQSPNNKSTEDGVASIPETTESAPTEPKPADETSAETCTTVAAQTEGDKSTVVKCEKFSLVDDKDVAPPNQGTSVPITTPASVEADETPAYVQSKDKGKGKQIEELNEHATATQDKSQKPKVKNNGSISPFAAARKQAQQAKLQAKAAKKKEKKQQHQKRKPSEKAAAGDSLVKDSEETEASPAGKDRQRTASLDWLTPEILDIATKFAVDQAEGQAIHDTDKSSSQLGKDLDVQSVEKVNIEASAEKLVSTAKAEEFVVTNTPVVVVETMATHISVEHQSEDSDDAEEHEEKKQPVKKKRKSNKKKMPHESSGDAASNGEAKEGRAGHDGSTDHQGQDDSKPPSASSTSITSKAVKEIVRPIVPLASLNSGVKGNPLSEHTTHAGHDGAIDSNRGKHLS